MCHFCSNPSLNFRMKCDTVTCGKVLWNDCNKPEQIEMGECTLSFISEYFVRSVQKKSQKCDVTRWGGEDYQGCREEAWHHVDNYTLYCRRWLPPLGVFCCPCLQGTRSIQTADKNYESKTICVPLSQLLFETYERSVFTIGNTLRSLWAIFSPDVGLFMLLSLLNLQSLWLVQMCQFCAIQFFLWL